MSSIVYLKIFIVIPILNTVAKSREIDWPKERIDEQLEDDDSAILRLQCYRTIV